MIELNEKVPVHNDGFVCLVDMMGSEAAVLQAARVSYGSGTKKPSDDRTLLRYLMRKRHTTPFEMAELKFMVRVPMDTWRQWIRHRTASVNEYSTRYSEAIDSCQTTAPDQWRLQSGTNKQGSAGNLTEWPEGWAWAPYENDADKGCVTGPGNQLFSWLPSQCSTPGGFLSWMEQNQLEHSQQTYQLRLGLGVAREQARKDLPLSTYTESYWKIDLHNLLHFLALRMDSHAQKEIRDYANVIGRIAEERFPVIWEAFRDYRLEAMQLTRLDIAVIQAATALTVESGTAIEDVCTLKEAAINAAIERVFDNKREAGECREKLQQLGLLP